MPLNFSDTLATGEGSFFNLVDLTQNRVKGIGYYASFDEVFSQPLNQRTLGFIAIVSDGESAAVYVYQNPNLDGWDTVDNWAQLGQGDDTASTEYGTYQFEYETEVAWVGDYDATDLYDDEANTLTSTRPVYYGLTQPFNDPLTAWNEYEKPFKDSGIASILPADTVFSTVSFRAHLSWGYQHYIELVLDSAYGFTGFTAAAVTKITARSWAQTGGDSDDEAIRNFILSIPSQYRAHTYQLAFPTESGSAPVRLVKLPSVVSDADMINPANWNNETDLGPQITISRYVDPSDLAPPYNEDTNPATYYKNIGSYPETTSQTVNIANLSLISNNFRFAQNNILPNEDDRGFQKPEHLRDTHFFIRWTGTGGTGWWQDNAAVLKTLPAKLRVEITCKI